MSCRVVAHPDKSITFTTITIIYIFFPFSLFLKKIIWYITCLVLGGWKEDLIPLLFGSVQIDRPFGWAAEGSGLKSAPLRFACIGKVSFWAQIGFCIGWEWAVELCTMKCEITFAFPVRTTIWWSRWLMKGRGASCARRSDGVCLINARLRHTPRQLNKRQLDG